MDSLTHLYFADRLLRMTGQNRAAGVASLFPQIDRVPAYFHRMYGHPIEMITRLLPVGEAVYWGGNARGDAYVIGRFRRERARMRGFEKGYWAKVGQPLPRVKPDRTSIVIAWLSHVYQ